MKRKNKMEAISPLELMLKWNRFCNASGKEGDCILLSERRTLVEAFANEKEAMKEIVNSGSPEFKRNEGYLVPVYDGERYVGMMWVPEQDIGDYIDMELVKG